MSLDRYLKNPAVVGALGAAAGWAANEYSDEISGWFGGAADTVSGWFGGGDEAASEPGSGSSFDFGKIDFKGLSGFFLGASEKEAEKLAASPDARRTEQKKEDDGWFIRFLKSLLSVR